MTGETSWTLDGKYTVHLDQKRGEAFAAAGPRGQPLVAFVARRGLPPRLRALEALTAAPIEGVLNPVAHGPGPSTRAQAEQDYYVLCDAPPGAAISGAAPRAWPEAELIGCVLLPAAAALGRLQALGLTHRAIRPDNLFQHAPGEPATLGQGWAAPPAALQPAALEPPYVACCPPAGRGDGSIADDVYALGALLVVLALGGTRLDGLAAEDVVRAKLDRGSFDALVGDAQLPAQVADLARGMLAEDPDHRPPPALLGDPARARARRLAARPPRRAAAAVRIGGGLAWTARTAAHAIAAAPEAGAASLASGAIDAWLRRGLGDPMLAARLDDAVHTPGGGDDPAADAAAMPMRAVAALDPLAPLCWRGTSLWPDAIGTAMAAAEAGSGEPATDALTELVQTEAIGAWARQRPERCDPAELRLTARRLRGYLGGARPGARLSLGARRLLYALNPLLPCASPQLGGRCVARLPDLLPALEAGAGAAREAPAGRIIDAEIAAFVAARAEHTPEAEMAGLVLRGGGEQALTELDLLARLQARWGGTVPALARRLAADHERLLHRWFGQGHRARLTAELARLAEAGQLAPMFALLWNPTARAEDEAGAQAAARRLVHLDAEIARLAAGDGAGRAAAHDLGQEIAAGLGLAALAAALLVGLIG